MDLGDTCRNRRLLDQIVQQAHVCIWQVARVWLATQVACDRIGLQAILVLLQKKCSEMMPDGRISYFTRHLHLQHLRDVPPHVEEMARITSDTAHRQG